MVVDPAEAAGAELVRAWEDDPGAPPTDRAPILRPLPDLAAFPLPVAIAGAAPRQDDYPPHTPGFWYWAAADALRRAADYWGSVLPDGTAWHPTVGERLTAQLDAGDDLNAYYDREGLRFFSHSVAGVTVHSGESPDVICHETGHAVLDAVRPELWDVASAEAAAFHESFGDISALLGALQLDQLRIAVLAETAGRLSRSSRLSRLAEQLGWAIRQTAPWAAEPDCLRNAANSFFYRDPVTLAPSAPAAELSSEPHSFSRVFTGAFLRILAGIFQAQQDRTGSALRQATLDAGRLLHAGVAAAPIVPAYYAQLAAHMIAADSELFDGRYQAALRSAFTRHGILSPASATTVAAAVAGEPVAAPRSVSARPAEPLDLVAIPGEAYGIAEQLWVRAPAQPARFQAASASPATGSLVAGDAGRAAASFVEDLFRLGRVAVPDQRPAPAAVDAGARTRTHRVVRVDGRLLLARLLFD
jgi:hypothetical protein